MRDILNVILSKLTGKSASEIASILARYVNFIMRTNYERKEESLAHRQVKKKKVVATPKVVLLNQPTGVRAESGQSTDQKIFKFTPDAGQVSGSPEPAKNKPKRVYARRGELSKGSRRIK